MMKIEKEVKELVLASVVDFLESLGATEGLEYKLVKPRDKKPILAKELVVAMLEKCETKSSTEIIAELGAQGNPVCSQICSMIRTILGLGSDRGAPSDPIRELVKKLSAEDLIAKRVAAIERAKEMIAKKK